MTTTQLTQDMENTLAGLKEYFDEQKVGLLFDADQQNQEIKEATLKEIKEVSEEK